MFKQYINKDAIESGLWTRWWEHVNNPTDKIAQNLEQSEVWMQMEPYLRGRGRILEAGCGLGQWVRFFSMKDFEAVGLDNCTDAIEIARNSFPQSNFILGDVCRMSFPDDYFDAVVSYGVLEHFEEGAEEPLHEHMRVLKPGGYLIVTVPYHNRWSRIIGRYPERGNGDGLGRSLRSGESHRTLSERELKSAGIISCLPVYEKASVFRQYLMHEKDLARLFGKIPQLETVHLHPFGVRASNLLPIRLRVWILYKTTYLRLVLRAVEKLLAPLLPKSYFSRTLLAIVKKADV